MHPEPLEKVEMGEESSGRVHRCSRSDSRWAGEQRARGPVLVPCWAAEPRACGLVWCMLSC